LLDDTQLVPGSTSEHTVCLLLKLGQVAFRMADERLIGLGLRLRHYSILQALADRGEMSQVDIGNCLRIDPATMVTTLDDLEQHGLAVRERHPSDRRRYVITLTDKGRVTLPELDRIINAVQDDVFADLDPAERDDLHRALTSLNTSKRLASRYDKVRSGS